MISVLGKLLKLDLGVAHTRPRLRLLPFRIHILRGHQPILAPYLSLSAGMGPQNVDRAEAIRITGSTSCTNRVRTTGFVGLFYYNCNVSLLY